jgi:regulator of ribonuclease activity A
VVAHEQGWHGVVVFGCVRDADEIGRVPIGVKALDTHPMRSRKMGAGQRDVAVRFGEVLFQPGHFVYADRDGIVVAAARLHPSSSP